MVELDKIIEQLSKLTVMEATDLAKKLEEKWDVTAAAPVASVAVQQVNDAAASDVEKSEYDVVIKNVGEKRINVLKEVKAITGLGLKEVRDLLESLDKPIKAGVSKKEAEELKQRLEAAGAQVDLK